MPRINRRVLLTDEKNLSGTVQYDGNCIELYQVLHTNRTSSPERLAERVWCTNSQSSLLSEYSLPSQCVPVLAPPHFIPSRCEYLFTQLRRNLSDMWRSNSTIGAALCTQTLSVTEIVPKSPFLYVNRSPICYGFLVNVRAIRNSANKD